MRRHPSPSCACVATSRACRIAPLLLLLLALMPLPGWCDSEAADLTPRLQLSLESRPRLTLPDSAARRAWLGPTASLPGNGDQTLTLAASMSAGPWAPRVRLGVESAALRRLTPAMTPDHQPLPQPQGLSLRSADPLADLRLGALFKMRLDNQSTLSLRPRGRRWMLTYQSNW